MNVLLLPLKGLVFLLTFGKVNLFKKKVNGSGLPDNIHYVYYRPVLGVPIKNIEKEFYRIFGKDGEDTELFLGEYDTCIKEMLFSNPTYDRSSLSEVINRCQERSCCSNTCNASAIVSGEVLSVLSDSSIFVVIKDVNYTQPIYDHLKRLKRAASFQTRVEKAIKNKDLPEACDECGVDLAKHIDTDGECSRCYRVYDVPEETPATA